MIVADPLVEIVSTGKTHAFRDVISVADSLVPSEFTKCPWKLTQHGTIVYTNQDQLNGYLAAYGSMHLAKLNYAFDLLDDKLREPSLSKGVNIIDWGCGQGTATCAFLDYLSAQDISIPIRHVSLLEVSKPALDRACALVSLYDTVEANTVYSSGSKLEEVDVSAACGRQDVPTIHFFSNILDVSAIDIGLVAKRALEASPAGGWIVCVGPCNAGCGRIDAFSNYFCNRQDEVALSELEHPYRWRDYSRQCTFKLRIFRIESETEAGRQRLRRIKSVYPGNCYQSGYRLDAVKKLGIYDEREWRTLCAFEARAPFDLGAHIYSDIEQGIDTDGILCVLNNAILRGLPTCASPFVEECFRTAFGGPSSDPESPVIEYPDTAATVLAGAKDAFPPIFLSGELPPSWHVAKDLDDERCQLLFSPIAIAHVEEILAEAFMCKRIPLDVSEAKLLVIERDVPCGAIAAADFSQMLKRIISLMAEPGNRRAPQFTVDVMPSERFHNSLLHTATTGMCRFVGPEAMSNRYDLVVEICALDVLDDTVYSGKSPLWTIGWHAQQAYDKEDVDLRCFRSTDNVVYRRFVDQKPNGEYVDIEAACDELRYFLQLFFRKRDFRPGQTAILDHALNNRTVIGLLPTGGGKSITYQLPVMLQPGPAVVVDPLVSLIEDQLRGLKAAGIDACAKFRSGMKSDDRGVIVQRFIRSNFKFAFMAPERLAMKEARNMFSQMWRVGVFFSYGVVDEVHCVSEWGHTFRPSYLHLGRNMHKYVRPHRKEINEEKYLPLIGLTATASFDVLADVERDLVGMSGVPLDDSSIVRYENTNRLELQYRVFDIEGDPDKWNSRRPNYVSQLVLSQASWLNELQRPENLERIRQNTIARESVLEDSARAGFIRNHKVQCELPDMSSAEDFCRQGGLVFCLTKSDKVATSVPRIRETLRNNLHNGERIGMFFGGGEGDVQEDHERFCRNELGIMVATKAFGMGVDKPNVRYVIEVFQPDSPESFVQEAGRAGRDGKLALATILYAGDHSDTDTVEYFLNEGFPGEQVELQHVEALLNGAHLYQTATTARSLNSILEHWNPGVQGRFTLNFGSTWQQASAYDNRRRERPQEKRQDEADAILKRLVYRLCTLGVIVDAETKYRKLRPKKVVSDQVLVILAREPGACFKSLRQYLLRYYAFDRVQREVERAKNFEGANEIEKCLRFMTHFAYRNIAQKRRRAIEDMQTFCKIGTQNQDWLEANEELKDFLYYYFNSKYARNGYRTPVGIAYSLVDESDHGRWAKADMIFKYARVCDPDIDDSGLPVDNIKHLLGAVRLIRRNNPANAAMGVLVCFCLSFLALQRNPTMAAELQRGYCEDGLISYLRNGDGVRGLTPDEFGKIRDEVDELISTKTPLVHDAPELFAEMQAEVTLAAENIWIEELLKLNSI